MTDHRRNTAVLGAALLSLGASATALPALADPYDYRDRRDTITSSAGNANASNVATHTVDPWPRYAKNRRIHLDGSRASLAITRYQRNQSIEPKGLNSTSGSGQDGQSGSALTK